MMAFMPSYRREVKTGGDVARSPRCDADYHRIQGGSSRRPCRGDARDGGEVLSEQPRGFANPDIRAPGLPGANVVSPLSVASAHSTWHTGNVRRRQGGSV